MAIVLTDIAGSATKSNGTTLVLTVPAGGVPSASLIVVCWASGVTVSTPTLTSVVDTKSNTYTRKLNTQSTTETGIAYCFNCTALVSGDTITLNIGTDVTEKVAASAFYATGVQTGSDPLDAFNITGAIVNTATPSITTNAGGSDSAGTTSVVGELIVAVQINGGPTGDVFTQDSTNQGGFSNFPVRQGTTGAGATSNVTLNGGAIAGWNSTGKPTWAPTITAHNNLNAIFTFRPAPTDTLFAQSIM